MTEYHGKSTQNYRQSSDKQFSLFPALHRAIPDSHDQSVTALDLACGTADLHDLLTNAGYSYTGLDSSADMLSQAQQKYPSATFIQASATDWVGEGQHYDLILINMLFPSISNHSDFQAVFQTASSHLKPTGQIVIGTMHPCFDGYMQTHLFDRPDIQTNFTTYFSSATHYQVHRQFDGVPFTFNDYHWQLSDYFTAATQAGLKIISLDECSLTSESPTDIRTQFEAKGVPIYLVLTLKSA